MALSRMLDGLPVLAVGGDLPLAALDVEVTGVSDDSRAVAPGEAFVAVAGAASDGHDHIAQAVASGAVAVLGERQIVDPGVPMVVLEDLKRLRSELASRIYGHPSRDLTCVGVTGTNGKTSIACFIAELADLLDRPAGYLGTIGWGTLQALAPSNLTTESAITIQRRLAALRNRGLSWAVLEASSHALDQHRVDAVSFDYAVFSNLSRDHLDYHQDLRSYGRAKARLFRFPELKAAVINVDDRFGRTLAEELGSAVEVIGCGTTPTAAVRWEGLEYHAGGVRGHITTPWGSAPFELPLYGAFQVANAAAALAVLCHAGAGFACVVTALGRLSAVPGRMEFFPGRPTLVVDYAHTPDALEKMLAALRPHTVGRLICVCGCGGDRDRGKRPLMAKAASEQADRLWLTSDNPRSEDPQAIIDDMLPGLVPGVEVEVAVDREDAIRRAVAGAGPDDLVVIAGKGHEDYQEIRGQRRPFSDRVLAKALTDAAAAGGG